MQGEKRGKIIKGINNNAVLEGQNYTHIFIFFLFFFSSISRPVRPDIIVVLTERKTPSYLLISRPVCM